MVKENIDFLSSLKRFWIAIVIFLFLLTAGLVINVNTGSVDIPAAEVLSTTYKAFSAGIKSLFGYGASSQELYDILNASTENQIIFYIRMPRMILAFILGGALSVSGFLLQTFFRNPIAGPFVLGISSGAKMMVGVTLIILSRFLGHINSMMLVMASFAGSLLITGLVLLFSAKINNMSMLLVIGIMVGYVCSAVTDLCINFASDNEIAGITGWSMGTFSGTSWDDVLLAIFICLPALIFTWLLSKPIWAYTMGENYAKSMGVNILIFRILIILLSSLLSACVTALAGPISFVGIAIPYITRKILKSSSPSLVIPACFLLGGVFCIFCDLAARTILSPTELSIGTITSILGAPAVIFIIAKRRRLQEV